MQSKVVYTADTAPVPCDQTRKAISENATRNIFRWLRFDGFARGENHVWTHQWFDTSESDEDEASEDEESAFGSPRSCSVVNFWLSNIPVQEHDLNGISHSTEQRST